MWIYLINMISLLNLYDKFIDFNLIDHKINKIVVNK